MNKMTNLVGQPIKRIGEFQEKTNKKKVAAARLEPWPIIFCSIPQLVRKWRGKSDGLCII
jgi:hypothetical protein